jgi:hypothetical protein
MSEPETTTDGQGGEAVEDLTAADEATGLQESIELLRRRKGTLNAMPDGPRPQVPGQVYKRRKVFVDWTLQVNYVGVYLATFTLLAIGFLALNYMFMAFFRRALAIQTQRPFAEHTDAVMLITINMVFVLLLVIGMAVYAIVQSHRVAGPVLRFRRALHQMHRRDYDFHLQLRSRDYLKDVAEQINGFNNALKHKDIVVSDAAMALGAIAERHPEVRADLEEVVTTLCDVVSQIPETEPEPAAETKV